MSWWFSSSHSGGHVEIANLAIRHVKFWTHSSCSWSARSNLILLVSSNHTLKRQCWEYLQIFIGAYQSCPRLGSRVRTELFRQSEGPSMWSLNCLSVGHYGNSTFRSHCIVQISAARRIPLKRWSVAKCLGKASTPVCHLTFTSFPRSYHLFILSLVDHLGSVYGGEWKSEAKVLNPGKVNWFLS